MKLILKVFLENKGSVEMKYNVEDIDVKKRLDKYVLEKNDKISRSYIKRLIEEGNITVNDKLEKSGYSLKKGDIIEVNIKEEKDIDIASENIPLDIIYEDDDFLIVNKKKGMVVHPANGNYTGTLVNALMYSHKDKLSGINGSIRPGIVHRIDKDTSGILVVAKNDVTHKKLSEIFKVHDIRREYIALVKGIIKEEKIDLNYPIGRSVKDRKKMAVTNINSKEAITHVEVLYRFYLSNVTLIKATLETGRTHQIRVHMAYINHPLVGDEVYGKKDGKFKVSGQMLHAKLLGFKHPKTGEYVEFESDLPDEFKNILYTLKRKENANLDLREK